MPKENPPQKPTNLRPYYEKHNKELLEALEKKGIILSKAELAEKLITDNLIMNVLLPQLDEERGIIPEGRYYH